MDRKIEFSSAPIAVIRHLVFSSIEATNKNLSKGVVHLPEAIPGLFYNHLRSAVLSRGIEFPFKCSHFHLLLAESGGRRVIGEIKYCPYYYTNREADSLMNSLLENSFKGRTIAELEIENIVNSIN